MSGVLALEGWLPAAVALGLLWGVDAFVRKRPVNPLVLILAAIIGFAYASHVLPQRPASPEWFVPREKVHLRGVVDSVRTKPDRRLQMVLRDVGVETPDGLRLRPLPGKLAWTWKFPAHTPEPGQSVYIHTRVRPVTGFKNPGLWDYEAYWQRRGVFWQGWSVGRKGVVLGPEPGGILWNIHQSLHDSASGGLAKGQGAAVVLNLMTGDRTHISPATLDMVRSAGLAHILALSGLHVGYVAFLGFMLAYAAGYVRPQLFLYIPRQKLAVCLGFPLVAVYAWLGQPSASLTRAAIMFFCWGGLLLVGRGRALIDGLFVALGIILLCNPLAVFDTGLRMSACAVGGIAVLYPVFRRRIHVFCDMSTGRARRAVCHVLDGVAALLCLSLAANVALLPLMAVSFGNISPNILMNVIWVPAVGFLVMPLGRRHDCRMPAGR